MNKYIKIVLFVLLIFIEVIVLAAGAASLNTRISTADAKQTDAHNNNYRQWYKQNYDESYQQAYETAYKSSYEQQYQAGYDDRYQKSYDEQYRQEYNLTYKSAYDTQYAVAYDREYQNNYDAQYAIGKDEGYQSGMAAGTADGRKSSVDLHDPSYKELMTFLTTDKTDAEKYDALNYNCFDYSADVNNNAELAGIRCAFVTITYPQSPGHAIIAFETTDKGLIYVEPQSDSRVNLVIGKRYYQCVVPKPGYYYTAPSYNDTIKEIEVIW